MAIDAPGLLGMLSGAPVGRKAAAIRQAAALERFLKADYPPEAQAAAAERYRRLAQGFQALCPGRSLILARAPGRINLIGEHTDYNGLPVLPFAIHRDLAAAFAPRRDAKVVLHNLEPAYPQREFLLQKAISPYPTGDWGNYLKAAAQGILDYFAERGQEAGSFRGLDIMIHGDIPPAAGLSSSSALVVLGAISLLAANGLEIPPLELAPLLARAEHYVGTQGGGMDQAVSLLARSGQALKIDFFPLRITPAPLPEGCAFVAANSLVTAAKTAEALDKYNRRPIECRLAVALIGKRLSARFKREVPLRLIGELTRPLAGLPEAELRAEADRALHREPYTLAEIAAELGSSPEATARTYCQRRDGTVFPQPADGFKLHQRYRHVLEEGLRVERSLQALEEGDLAELGRLMDRSHESCRDLYEISCPELDALTAICREAGAEGSRLTGAGFGGFTISLVRAERLPEFLARVGRAYYQEYLGRLSGDLSSILFPCMAVNGAETLF
jgi:N-acetylgalactosamine kinase